MPLRLARASYSFIRLPVAAKRALLRDHLVFALRDDPGPKASLHAGFDWLLRAQSSSTSCDGGVARHYSLITGWGESYPETTGYIVPTMLAGADRLDRPELENSARRMCDWLVSIQHPDGGFVGGTANEHPRVQVTFNTGQILLGLASASERFGPEYVNSMSLAANWLETTMDADGAWRRFPTPFAKGGTKVYETHVSWGLFEAARVRPQQSWMSAAIRNIDWALGHQLPNGWLSNCCLNNPAAPLTHTLGYALRGVVEAYIHSGLERFLTAAERTASALVSCIRPDGFLAGRWDSSWNPAVTWACLTGSAQIAHSWLLLYRLTGNEKYRHAAQLALQFVRRTIDVEGNHDIVGGVKGSHPIEGGYRRFEYLNWAVKFFIDAQLLDLEIDGYRVS